MEESRKDYGWLVRGGNAAVGCSSMWTGILRGEYYCGNLLWQSSLTLLSLLSPRTIGSDSCDTVENLANGVATGRRIYGIILLLSGIELRGDGGTNGSLESRGLKLS